MIVEADGLCKTFRVADKAPGFAATVRHLVRRRTKDVHAVRDVSFALEAGEVVGFLGENGAGKTTTLKMLTGLVKPSAGRATVVGHTPFARRRDFLSAITLVMGNKQQLVWDLPAGDSFRIHAAVYRLDDRDVQRRVTELSEMLDITDKLTTPVRKLSLGERMKLELVASLLHQPKVLFLDEPTLGLDVNAQQTIRAFIRDYNAQHGATVLLTSHYMADITALTERVVVLHQGGLVYDGSLSSLVSSFVTTRQVVIKLRTPVDGADLAGLGAVDFHGPAELKLRVERDALQPTLAQILERLPVVDLTVTAPPVEDTIGHILKTGQSSKRVDA